MLVIVDNGHIFIAGDRGVIAIVTEHPALIAPFAEPLFELALSEGAAGGRPLEVARVRLAYGEWLRRSQRRVDARVHLRHALETFQDVRAEALRFSILISPTPMNACVRPVWARWPSFTTRNRTRPS